MIGLTVVYSVPEQMRPLFAHAAALPGIITGTRPDGTVDILLFSRFRPNQYADGVAFGEAEGEWQFAMPPPIAAPKPEAAEG